MGCHVRILRIRRASACAECQNRDILPPWLDVSTCSCRSRQTPHTCNGGGVPCLCLCQRILCSTRTCSPLLTPPLPSPGRAPILVVDDDEDLRETLVMVLDIEGFRVSHGTTTAEALDYLRAAACCHVVLLDYALWGGNTEALLCAGDHDARLARHSYALMTGRELAQFSDEVMRLITAHCTAFLLKPFDLEQLLGVVKRA